ncbi:MAG: hypothetical protein Q9184_005571 [Pyrenodesmia sp. 2 TL-2023]
MASFNGSHSPPTLGPLERVTVPYPASDDTVGDGYGTIEICITAGQMLWDALQDRLRDNDPKDLEGYDDINKDNYQDMVEPNTSPDAGAWRSLFHDLSIDHHLKDYFALHIVTAKQDKTAAHQNLFNIK